MAGLPRTPGHPFWSLDAAAGLHQVRSTAEGLTSAEAAARLRDVGPNAVTERAAVTRLGVLSRQLRSPLLLLLVFAAVASVFSGALVDASIVLAIVAATVGLGYSREYRAHTEAEALRSRLHARVTATRDGQAVPVPVEDLVPGDVVLLSAGNLVPADGLVLASTDCYVSEALLTGESYPVLKQPGRSAPGALQTERTNAVFMGTNVRSGSARCLVVQTGGRTEFGAIAHRLMQRAPETEFDRGIRHFGYLLTTAMLVFVLVVFAAHMLGGRPPAETLLFAIALAVGLSPELLPAILSVNLARATSIMAAQGVLVRRLPAIENLGSMDVLCTDKTGTLTEGVIELEGAYDAEGDRSAEVLQLAAWNAALEAGIASPLDDAILAAQPTRADVAPKRGEIPFDSVRKRVTIAAGTDTGVVLIMKGAFEPVIACCVSRSGGAALDDETRAGLRRRYEAWSRSGIRVVAVATRPLPCRDRYTQADERDMVFRGFLTFLDRPKAGVADAIARLTDLGVRIKLITGDSDLVARHVAGLVGLSTAGVLSGREIERMTDAAFWRAAEQTDLFVEVDPNQKARIIAALKRSGHVVGFLGDGVNDAPAMHTADTSLSVDQAVDVARDAADFVLLERGLDVIRRGIEEGRRTFANTLKYVLITTSANLGNMLSMAVASLFLPFLPLTAVQILLNNLLSDVPAVGLAGDAVDPEMVDRPRRWNMRFIGRYMLEFGALSSAFDLITFMVLLRLFRAAPDTFRTGWFVESLLTELAVALVVRTRRPFYRSRPGTVLLASTVIVFGFALVLPALPVATTFGLIPIGPALTAALLAITATYVAATEFQKHWFYRRPW